MDVHFGKALNQLMASVRLASSAGQKNPEAEDELFTGREQRQTACPGPAGGKQEIIGQNN